MKLTKDYAPKYDGIRSLRVEDGIIVIINKDGAEFRIDPRYAGGTGEEPAAFLAKMRKGASRAAITAAINERCAKHDAPRIITEGMHVFVVEAEVVAEAKGQREALEPENRIEGLRELQAAIARASNEAYRYGREFRAMMDDEGNDGACPPDAEDKSHAAQAANLRKQYPRAAAYIKADRARDPWHTGAASRAKERILNGEDYEAALADMAAEINKAAEDAAWTN